MDKNYPAKIINIGIEKAFSQTPEELRRVREQTKENNLLCLVTTYNPNNPQVYKLVRETLPMLNQSSSLKTIMSKTKVIHSQRQPRNLKRMLTNSYFARRNDTDPEVKICGTKRCGTCPYLKEGKEFTFSATNETFRIKHSMSCTSNNLIYVITYRRGRPFLTMVTRWSRSTSNFYALIGQNLTGELMRKIHAASWKLFTLTAEADRVLCQLVMCLTVFFH